MGITFKIASDPAELEQVHRLNYRTFVEEIPQHPPNPDRALVDRRLEHSTCFIALDGSRVVGMVAICGTRPFSLDAKLPDLDRRLPPATRPCEIRLLAVEKGHRGTQVFGGLLKLLVRHARAEGYDLAVISAAARQTRLYRHLGFVPFGPPIGTDAAPYQGMLLTWDRLAPAAELAALVSLLPGPVPVAPDVRAALNATPVSHRSESFARNYDALRRRLCALARARHCAILAGPGTLANDAVALQLRDRGRGAVVATGEFGERLADHARRAALDFDVVEAGWGSPPPLDRIGAVRWIWAVHCETSTGVLHDLDALKRAARERDALLCLDAISSIGTVPLDLDGVFLATATSGKGLGAVAGLGIVFHDREIAPSGDLPRALDLGLYAVGTPFTVASGLVAALARAVERDPDVAATAALGAWLRGELEAAGARPLAPREVASPAVITWRPADAAALGARLEREGFLLSWRSAYLAKRGLIQACLFGRHDREELERLAGLLAASRG